MNNLNTQPSSSDLSDGITRFRHSSVVDACIEWEERCEAPIVNLVYVVRSSGNTDTEDKTYRHIDYQIMNKYDRAASIATIRECRGGQQP